MWTLSGFTDEIDDDFATQCRVVTDLGLTHIEIRSAWGTNILDLDADQLATVQRLLAEHGLRVSSIGSPIGKIAITDDFGPHLDRMRQAAEVAQLRRENARLQRQLTQATAIIDIQKKVATLLGLASAAPTDGES